MEPNDNAQHGDAGPRRESPPSAEEAPVPAVPLAQVLNRLGIRPAHRDDETGENLVKALSSSEGSTRAAAIQALGKQVERGEQIPTATVVSALHDPEWSVRALAALTLRLGGERVPIEPLLDALHDEDESVRAAAARALGAMGERVPLQALEDKLRDDTARVREAVVLTLGELGQRVPAEVLLAATKDSDEAVREAAGIALRQSHPSMMAMANQAERNGQSENVQNRRPVAVAEDKHRRVFVKRSLSQYAVAVAVAAVIIAGGSILSSLLPRAPGSGQRVQRRPTTTGFSFYGPGYSALDSRGNLYVVDSNFQQTQTRILKFSPAGDLLTVWDHLNINAQPLYIVPDRLDDIYATAQGTDTIYKLSATGKLLLQWQVVGADPVGLALDKQGNIYVAVFGGNTIQKYSPSGKLLATWGTPGSGPGQFDHPAGVAVDGQGNIYVTDQGNGRIQKLAPTGKPLAQWGSRGVEPGQFLRPGSIAVDRQDNIYVTDGRTGLVQKFSSTGKLLAVWGSGGTVQFGIPRGIAVDAEGNIYVASVDLNGLAFINGRITKLSSIGELLAVWR